MEQMREIIKTALTHYYRMLGASNGKPYKLPEFENTITGFKIKKNGEVWLIVIARKLK